MADKDSEKYKGYRNIGLDVLKKNGVEVWSEVRAFTKQGEFEGIILPRSETADDRHIVLKVVSGYNVGLAAETIERMEAIGYRAANYKIPEKEFPYDKKKPNVRLFGTGGTIASRLDYRTGAVIPAFSPGELYGSVPELADICNLTTEKLFGVFSENMGWKEYAITANKIGEAIREGAAGIVIGHGTDTHAPHGGGAQFYGARQPRSDFDGRFPAFQRPTQFGCCDESDSRLLRRRAQ